MKGGETLDGFVIPSHMSGMKTISFVFWGTQITMVQNNEPETGAVAHTFHANPQSLNWRIKGPGLHSKTLSQPSKRETKQINRKGSTEGRFIVQGLLPKKTIRAGDSNEGGRERILLKSFKQAVLFLGSALQRLSKCCWTFLR